MCWLSSAANPNPSFLFVQIALFTAGEWGEQSRGREKERELASSSLGQWYIKFFPLFSPLPPAPSLLLSFLPSFPYIPSLFPSPSFLPPPVEYIPVALTPLLVFQTPSSTFASPLTTVGDSSGAYHTYIKSQSKFCNKGKQNKRNSFNADNECISSGEVDNK